MLKLRDIKKTYVVDNQHFPALKNINLTFPDKGFVSILGPSGCGKTTLLNLIGGLDQYTAGDLIINNKSTKKFTDRDWDAYRNKRVGFVFQTYNLVPHLTVLGNVELSMTLTGMNKKERQRKAALALKRVGLKDALKKKPNQLSGGQMQRVAIARSLVNNPEIVLADEPTGALDSVTSVQVMEILKEVAKDRLVIMVTHNNELAKKYSTRIIRLKDGRVISDTHPEKGTVKKEIEELEKEKNKHTHMSFFTALGSSAKSLLTKKGRTAMTAVAASFGIIGVALVLAMSNGFTGYVNRVEMSTAASVPITISPFVTTAIKEVELPEAWPSEEVIKPYTEDISTLVTIHHNNITPEFADYARGLRKEPNYFASSVLENHEYLDFNIFTQRKETNRIIKVNQFKAAGAGGSILSGTTGLPSTIFHELYGDKKYIDSLYEVIKGTYPKEEIYEDSQGQKWCDVCLICDRYNRIPTGTLYSLGLVNSETLDEDTKISFDDLLNHEYRAFLPEQVYTAVSSDPVTTTVQSRKVSESTSLALEEGTEEHEIKQYKNVVATEDDDITYKYPEKLNALYNNNERINMKITGILRIKKSTLINLMPGSVCYPTALKNYFVDKIKDDSDYAKAAKDNWVINANCTQLQWTSFMTKYFGALATANTSNWLSVINSIAESPFTFYDILTDTDTVKAPTLLENQFTKFQNNQHRFAIKHKQPIFKYQEIEGYKVAYDIDMDSIDNITDANLFVNGYSTITSVLIFPKDLTSKQQVFKYLDQWNVEKEEINQIKYADIAGTLTDALGTMIDIISIVLIVFSSVSLLVSCVMTGIITYTSVLERTKEIGILRAIGARKKDVGRLFEAESVIIGAIAGLAGVIFTFIVEWPISLAINSAYPEQNIGMICNLSPWHALILVIISILLTFISGFIPARKASKKDPVVALRTE